MINNAQCALAIEEDTQFPSFRDFIYQTAYQLVAEFSGNEDEINKALMKLLKKRGLNLSVQLQSNHFGDDWCL